MNSHHLLFPLIALFLSAGCSGGREPVPPVPKAAGEAIPAAAPSAQAGGGGGSLRIEPGEVTRGTQVRLSPSTPPPAGAEVEWLVNGAVENGGKGSGMDTSRLRKGDTLQARAVAAGGAAFSQVVKIRNSPPEVRGVRFHLGVGGPGSSLGVEAEGADADGDPVQFEYAWRKNGEPAAGDSRLGAPVKRGDKIEVTITPFDGEERGRSATLVREIRNTTPVIEGQEQFQVSGNVVTFRVRAYDADGDPLNYTLKEAPASMRIERTTGWVRWETSPGGKGKVPFTVLASDGHGGEATARITVTIAEQSPSATR